MSRYNDIISSLGNCPIFCNNLGFGEQGSVLKNLPKSLFICPDVEYARNMQSQLNALHRENVIIDDFDNPFTISTFQSNEHKLDTIKTIFNLINGNPIIISTPEILFNFIPDIKTFAEKIIEIDISKEYDIIELEKKLVDAGYKKVETLTTAGEFSRRGDILDIFNSIDSNPTRLDFFDTQIENIYQFDLLTFEKIETKQNIKIAPNKLLFLSDKQKENLLKELNKLKLEDNIIFDLISKIDLNADFPLEFIYPFEQSISTFAELNIPIIVCNNIQFANTYSKHFEIFINKIKSTFNSEKLLKIYKNTEKILKINNFYEFFANNLIFFDNYDINSTNLINIFSNYKSIDFKTINLSNYLNNLQKLNIELKNYLDKQIYLCLNSIDTLNAVKQIFDEQQIPYSTNKNSKGIILTELNIPYNICFEDSNEWFIGSTNFAHKKKFKKQSKTTVKYLPKANEYVVHSTHGIGKCEGVVNVKVNNIDKEFFKISYRGGDILYVPYENADCLSLYLTEGTNVHLNKLGGKEFQAQKIKAIKSIEDMSEELLELYAKRKSTKGFKYPEDDYLFTEFENSFEFTETIDQLQAISDIKSDMHSGKVMDRLICGDVGFGKTEVAMRALFKTVEAGKQVAVLAPTTILSLQHYLTTIKRTKNFGVRADMLNRFKSSKEQKQIIEDLRDGNLDVVCGTHRLLSDDVKFKDLGLLILDEEQRFGVKAKEKLKQIKNNVNVLTLSATPIPRTLSMTLMSIRDISIINTAPTNRLPVKTYVLCYNEQLVINAINQELDRDGQVLIVYNNIEQLLHFASALKEKVKHPKAKFDIAHGQMSEVALENAVKRLYDRETNVFISTTLIENGVDLPKANTLIILDSDKLGLSQMYQLRGRVGRNSEQAYAYFTYNKDKVLTEESTSRLQAIAENTELGSGFKIAMRDLQIRGAGELLGKTQHGHMIKIGYDMYSKLLNDTIKKLRGEKVEIEQDVKIDVAIPSKIPYSFVADETERLKIIAKISNVNSKESAKSTITSLFNEYGKLPAEIYHLVNISLLKSFAIKQNVKQITITKNKMAIIFYENVNLNKLISAVKLFPMFKFEKGTLPTLTINPQEYDVSTGLSYFLQFLGTNLS